MVLGGKGVSPIKLPSIRILAPFSLRASTSLTFSGFAGVTGFVSAGWGLTSIGLVSGVGVLITVATSTFLSFLGSGLLPPKAKKPMAATAIALTAAMPIIGPFLLLGGVIAGRLAPVCEPAK